MSVALAVEDSGIGLSDEQMTACSATLADSSTTRQYGGSGLGRNVAGADGGDVALEIFSGHGSRFVVTVQLGTAPHQLRRRRHAGSAGTHPTAGRR